MTGDIIRETMIEGGEGGRIEVDAGQLLEIVNVDGKQVCDFFAFSRENIREFLSPSHQRSVIRRLWLEPGDKLYSVIRRPMFELVSDDVGTHDFSIPACDPERYLMDFGVDEHRSCRKNLEGVMSGFDIPYEFLPDPFNFFQPTPVNADGTYGSGTSPSKPGDKSVLRALMDVHAVGSSCPQDQTPLNDRNPSRIQFVVRSG